MNTFSFTKVPPLHFGAGTRKRLPEIVERMGSKTIGVITGQQSLDASGVWTELNDQLAGAGIAVHRVRCSGEPSPQFVDATCDRLRPHQIDAVIAIGGGSVVDAGKAISAMLPHPHSVVDHLEGVGKGIPHSGIKVPFIAMPTTSGTGGEVTKNAVLSEVGFQGFKKSIRHEQLVPDVVIVDGELLTDCPANVTAACGLDALTQLIEPYLSPTASPLTDAIAWSGIEAVHAHLLPACGDQAHNIETRLGMAYGSLCSGIALANAGLGIVHGLASPLGGFFPIPHGVVCGTLLASAMKWTWQALQARSPDSVAIAKITKLGALFDETSGKDPQYYGESFIHTLEAWVDQLGLPRLGHYGVTAEDLDRILDRTRNRNNPIDLTRDEIRALVLERL